jgi:hypothetical protein
VCLCVCSCIDIMNVLYVNLDDLVEVFLTASPAVSSLEPAASLLEPGAGSLPPSAPVCEEEIATFSEVRDVYLLSQVQSHTRPRCGHRACCRKGYVEVGSGGKNLYVLTLLFIMKR